MVRRCTGFGLVLVVWTTPLVTVIQPQWNVSSWPPRQDDSLSLNIPALLIFTAETQTVETLCSSGVYISASFFPARSRLVNQGQKRLELHQSAPSVPLPKPNGKTRRTERERWQHTAALMEIKTSTYQERFSPEESKLEGWKDVPRIWEAGKLDLFSKSTLGARRIHVIRKTCTAEKQSQWNEIWSSTRLKSKSQISFNRDEEDEESLKFKLITLKHQQHTSDS